MKTGETIGYTTAPEDILLAPQFLEPDYSLESKAPYTEFPDLGNKELPFYKQKQEFAEALDTHQVVIVLAPTGNGKSTQAPQIALEREFDTITVTQPRRDPARNVAERITSEIAAVLGEDKASQLVSFQTGGGLTGSKHSRIKVVTEELLLNKDAFQPTDGEGEVWMLDEWHEKSNVQFVLGGEAKAKLARNPNFRVVVMSATADKQKLIEYWTSDDGVEPAVIESEGATTLYEIKRMEKPDSDSVNEAVLMAIDIHKNPPAQKHPPVIQVFEAGKREIKDTINGILSRLPPEVARKTLVVPNHRNLTMSERVPVYAPFDGIKIIVQTNIGKTSTTIPGTVCVISSGVERTNEIDDEDSDGLFEYDSTQDSLIQEFGRGGRTNASIGILTKHPGKEFKSFKDRNEYLPPEITRSRLDRVVMALAFRGKNIRTFNGSEEVNEASMERAIHRLQAIGVLNEAEEITSLGKRMAKYPTKIEHQRSLVEAESWSQQVQLGMAAMIAVSEVGGIKLHDKDRGTRWETLTDEACSDALAQLDTFIAVQELIKTKKFRELEDLDLDIGNILKAEETYRKIANRFGIFNIPELKPPNSQERDALRTCLVTGFVNSVYLPKGSRMFEKLGALVRPREISNRSVVSRYTRSPIVGTPRNIEMYQAGQKIVKPIAENVTEVSYEELARIAAELTVWMTTKLQLRNEGYYEVQEQMIGPKVIGSREIPAEASPAVRAEAIAHARRSPGVYLTSLLSIKSTLRTLAHKAKTPIPLLTQDMIDDLVEQAAPETIHHPSLIEHNLREIITERGISLEFFVAEEEQARIHANAPDSITFADTRLKLTYRNHRAIASGYSMDMLDQLPDEICLEDGRTVYFLYDDRRYTIGQLKRKVEAERLY